jgi:hypothetical protein
MPLNLALADAIDRVQCRPAAYVISCDNGSYLYKGSCRDLRRRLRDQLWQWQSRKS